jgi:L-ribulose-5-phosphate 3-epimerase UlaE
MAPRRLSLPLLLPASLEQWRQHVRHRLQQNRQVQAQQHLRVQRPVRHQLPHQLRLLHFGNGFAMVAYGNAPDEVHGLVLCRGDILDNVTCC